MNRIDHNANAIEGLVARVDALQAACERLARENAQLHASLEPVAQRGTNGQGQPNSVGPSPAREVSRRGLLTVAGVAAAAAAAGGALERPDLAGAANGDSVTAGNITNGSAGPRSSTTAHPTLVVSSC